MTETTITNWEDFLGLEAEWTGLLERSAAKANPFLSWSWVYEWWLSYGGRSQLHVITFRHDGALVGVVPLYLTRYLGVISDLRLIGAGWADAGGVIFESGREADLWAATLELLDRWSSLTTTVDLSQLEEVPPGVQTDPSRGIWVSESCPRFQMQVPETPEAYLGSLSRKFLKNLTYYQRRLEREFRVEYVQTRTPQELEEQLEAFFALHEQRWRSEAVTGAFSRPGDQEFFRRIGRRFLAEGKLELHLLRLDGRYVAAMLAFVQGGRCSYYNSGFDPTFAKYNVASLMLLRLILASIDRGVTVFDFLRGGEEYKRRWGAELSAYCRLRQSGSRGTWFLVRVLRFARAGGYLRALKSYFATR